MQELALIRPGSTADTELVLELDKTALKREFEERLAECGTLAFRVARGVLRNGADAEDVAQEAMLQAYRRFERLRDRSRFRAWLVRITFRLALDQARSSRRRLQFHIKENDYFGTLATVLDLVSQDLRKKGHRGHAETLGRLRDRLMYLQQGYRIEKMQSHTKIAGPL